MALGSISYVLNKRKIDRKKMSIYECGNQRMSEIVNKKYYLNYYKIAMIYILFDLEIILLLPFVGLGLRDYSIIKFALLWLAIGIGIIYEIWKLCYSPEGGIIPPEGGSQKDMAQSGF